MKTERIEFVAPPGLKARLHQEAAAEKVSVGELIRQRFEPSADEQELARLTEALKSSTAEASHALANAINEVSGLIAELRERRDGIGRKAA